MSNTTVVQNSFVPLSLSPPCPSPFFLLRLTLSAFSWNGLSWSKLIWNANYPSFIASNNEVDVYLYLASSDSLIQTWTSLPNAESQLAFQPTDLWWVGQYGASELPEGGREWEAYFIVNPSGRSLVGTEVHQSTFVALQTALPTTVSLSLASVSSTRSLSSVYSAGLSSSVSTASVASVTSQASISSLKERIKTDPVASSSVAAQGGIGSLQGDNSASSGLPKYAVRCHPSSLPSSVVFFLSFPSRPRRVEHSPPKKKKKLTLPLFT